MDAYFVVGIDVDLSKYSLKDKIVIGIDKGAYLCYEKGIPMLSAVGDFDSIDSSQFQKLQETTKIIKLNPIKDDTDTAHALSLYHDYDHLYLLGAIGGKRIDHFLANLMLFEKYPNLVIVDDYTEIRRCQMKENFQKDEYKYYSFFALEKTEGLTLKGFKYPLHNYTLEPWNPLGVSNELLEEGKLSFQKGKLLLMKTKEDRK